jgi:hypothetical protein
MSEVSFFWRGGTSGRHIDITLKGMSDIIYTVNARKYRWRSRPTHTHNKKYLHTSLDTYLVQVVDRVDTYLVQLWVQSGTVLHTAWVHFSYPKLEYISWTPSDSRGFC